jgi:hypothetical protein
MDPLSPPVRFVERSFNREGLAMTRMSTRNFIRAPYETSVTPGWRSFARAALVIIAFFVTSSANSAEPSTSTAIDSKSLDEQVQDIKTDVLAIAAELNNLEEKLIFPSNTQIAVFVSFDSSDQNVDSADEQDEGTHRHLPIDSARISIDGEPVSQHVYTFKELDALRRGGVQRIYTGNLRTGKHSLSVAIASSRDEGKTTEEVVTFEFEKEVDPKSLGVVLRGQSNGKPQITIENW